MELAEEILQQRQRQKRGRNDWGEGENILVLST